MFSLPKSEEDAEPDERVSERVNKVSGLIGWVDKVRGW